MPHIYVDENKPVAEITGIFRPFRVAYVVEDTSLSRLLLDQVFADAFARLAGRSSLVVPVLDGNISDGYLLWLKHFDPDVIHVATSDNQKIATVLAGNCSPSTAHFVDISQKNWGNTPHKFRHSDQALSALTWLPYLRNTVGVGRPRPEVILDSYPQWRDDGLVSDNFGTLWASLGNFPSHQTLKDFVRPLLLTPIDAPEDRWGFKLDSDESTCAYDLLSQVGNAGKVTTLASLSSLNPFIPIGSGHKWAHSFCVVVGDSFADRVACWNADLLYPNTVKYPCHTLRLPASVLGDARKAKSVQAFLNANNWISPSGGQPLVTVRSATLSEEQLSEFTAQLSTKECWSSFAVAKIGSLDDCCPELKSEVETSLPPRRGPSSVQVPLRHASEFAPVPQPIHFKLAYLAHPMFFEGSWIAEYTIDRTNDNIRFSNVRDVWTIPQRTQLGRLFVPERRSRITLSGKVAAAVNRKSERVEITEPSDEDFFASLLTEPQNHVVGWEAKVPPYAWSRPSDKGRYLQGVIGLFGTLNRAYEVLNHDFWKKQFLKLCNPAEDQYPDLVHILKKRLKPQGGKYSLETDGQWEKLARVVARMTPQIRVPRNTTKLESLVAGWQEHLESLIASRENLDKHHDRLISEARQDLIRSLNALCQNRVFNQGYGWSCGHCAYRNWTALDALQSTLECQVCGDARSAPVDLVFDFRLNDFLGDCLREHDTLSVIWALGRLQRTARDSFIFAPQTELFRKFPEGSIVVADREIDVLCVVDGKVVIGEVKASLSEIDGKEIENLVALASEYRPEMLFIGALSGGKMQLKDKLSEVQSQVDSRIQVIGFLRSDGDTNSPDFHLP